MPDTDELIRYATRLEGLSLSISQKLQADIAAVVVEIDDELKRIDAANDSRTTIRLRALRDNLSSFREGLRAAIIAAVGESLNVVIETTGPSLAKARFVDSVPPVQLLSRIGEKSFDGRTWQRWGLKLADDALDRVESDLRRGLAAGEVISKTRDRLKKTLSLTSIASQRLAITSINDISNAARVEMIQKVAADVVTGWRYVATLDGRTSLICSGLDGRIFPLNDPGLPRPPRHPNCRSVLIPITRASGVGDPQRASVDGPVSASLDFEAFLQRQSVEFQREYLGQTRYRAWKRGLPISKMATADRPLSVQELKNIYPQKFAA